MDSKLFVEQLSLEKKRVLVRVDFNVPLDGALNILDASRVEAALETIQYILKQGGTPILISHLGRPKNSRTPELSLAPVARLLSGLLDRKVVMAPDCVGTATWECVHQLKSTEVLLLENVRFHRGEQHPEENPEFARELARFGDVYVNDAFAAAHRKESSTYTLARHFPEKAAAGYLMRKEVTFLGDKLLHPERPFHALLGGAKVSSKIGVIQALLKKCDQLLLGGAMAATFLKAAGVDVGGTFVEEAFLPLATMLLKDHRNQIVLPLDSLFVRGEKTRLVSFGREVLASDEQAVDLGPETLSLFKEVLQRGKTIFWNGPLGIYENPQFAKATEELARYIGSFNHAVTIAGGGDLVAAIKRANLLSPATPGFTHLSTGGGATLEYIEYGTLPGIEALSPSR